ncbi:MAG TPA: T9SS type A sorting domain-containing protein, partial [Cryomorphaceae bacterium]|nr:T9SS type A sorting domain-containing protein [Cryomorphaceae bacterium]
VQLITPMNEGETYLVRFYVSLAERSLWAIHALQVLFSNEYIADSMSESFLDIQPQLSNEEGNYLSDREEWMELSWEYTADGTEQYMYIGNFQSNAIVDTLLAVPDSIDSEDHFSSYYYIDDVYVGTDLLSVREMENSFSFKLWPNPVDLFLTVQSERPIQSIRVHSVLGKLIKEYSPIKIGRFELDVSSLASGSYILVARDKRQNRAAELFIKR